MMELAYSKAIVLLFSFIAVFVGTVMTVIQPNFVEAFQSDGIIVLVIGTVAALLCAD